MAQNYNTTFCRVLLATTMEDVRPLTTAKQRKEAWVIRVGRQHWEFHGPDDFYWHGGADNAYDARASGWNAWLEKNTKKESRDGDEE